MNRLIPRTFGLFALLFLQLLDYNGGEEGKNGNLYAKKLNVKQKNEFSNYFNPLRVRTGLLQFSGQSLSPELHQKAYTTSKGINALLITDNSMLESAFSFGIGCGYYQDPESIPGLAHLMEHVTFLGSEDNPDPIGWDEFLLEKGGVSNAYTTADSTVFYILTIPRELENVMSYFAKMLVKPIIDENSSVSEIDAVNQEHEKNIPNKIRVMIELALHLSPKECPARKFGTGSKETLYDYPIKNNIDLRNALVNYHKKCYTSGNISLVVMGPQSEAELKKIVDHVDSLFPSDTQAEKDLLADKKRNYKFTNIHGNLSPMASGQEDALEKIQIGTGYPNQKANSDIDSSGGVGNLKVEKKSSKDRENEDGAGDGFFMVNLIKLPKGDSSPPLIIVYWDSLEDSLDIMRNNAEWQMLKLIQYYFEDQGPNSIFNRLQKDKLASTLEYFDNTSSKYSIYGLLLTATDDSDETTKHIVDIVSNYINNLIGQVSNSEDDKWISNFYRNYSSMANIDYLYDENRNIAATVSQAAENMLFFPDQPEIALSAYIKPYNITQAEKLSSSQINSLKAFVDSLRPEKMKVIKLTDVDIDEPGSGYYFEPYKVNYSVSKIKIMNGTSIFDKVKETNKAKNGKEEFSSISELLTCVPQNLEIVKVENDRCPTYKENGKEVSGKELKDLVVPCPLVIEDGLNIFWKGPIHKTPTISITFVQRLKNEDIKNNTRRALLAKIHAIIQNVRITFSLSSQISCGLETNIIFNRGRFVFNIQSYSSNFADIINEIKNSVVSEKNPPTESEFENALKRLKLDVLNLSEAMAYDIASDIAYSVYLSNYYSQIELRDALLSSEIKYEEYLEGVKGGFLSLGYIDSIVIGNITPDDAIKYVRMLESSFVLKSIPYSETAQDGVVELQKDVHITIKNPISDDMNNAVVAHFVTPPVDLIDSSIYYSIGEMTNSQFYDILRTEWQDGYVAFVSMDYRTPSMSLIAGVQTVEKDPSTLTCHLFSAFELIFKDFKEDLVKSSKAEFENKIRWFGLSQFSTHALDTFSNYVGYMSKLIVSHELCFEKNRLIEDATQMFISDPSIYIDKFKSLIDKSSNSSRRIVLVELIGNNEDKHEGETETKLNRILNVIEPPSNQECVDLVKNRLSNFMEIKLLESGDKNLRGTKNAFSRDGTNRKYVTYDQDKQCTVHEENAVIASGKDSKQVRSLLSVFGKNVSFGRNKNGERLLDIANRNKGIKKRMCNHNKM
ncbi:secreted insulinase-like peptidase [Cryptosporidium ryanae]|uniref:secreted insulinase-like peptidase n=1 Tax=Cryptosporidium ryanae TaxID=515981 RepID=UPI00351AA87C|nr:secreted insulinase-like peptidase [Cryptosporidium ryanae]